MADAPTSYPLAWPPGRPRTHQTRPPQFFTEKDGGKRHPVTIAEAVDRLERQLEMLSAQGPVLSTNLELRLDGQPRARRGEPDDHGVAVYFHFEGKPIALSSDSYALVAQNIAAIAAHIEATRRIERYGVATTSQMFTGFLALPAPIVVDDWRAALGEPKTLEEAEAAFRTRMRRAHPDVGGSTADAAVLTAAITAARRAYGNG